jgi:hypothetical protein
MHATEFRRCLENMDVRGIRRIWRHVSPDLPQPSNDHDALVAIHHARTQAQSIAFKLRAYSHRWLIDSGYPSALPDRMKPSAERIYPKVAEAVGISVNARSELFKPVVAMVRGAMEDAVMDAFADGRTDRDFVAARMSEAKQKSIKQLLGKIAV